MEQQNSIFSVGKRVIDPTSRTGGGGERRKSSKISDKKALFPSICRGKTDSRPRAHCPELISRKRHHTVQLWAVSLHAKILDGDGNNYGSSGVKKKKSIWWFSSFSDGATGRRLLGDLCKATRPLPRGARAHPAGRGGEGKTKEFHGVGGEKALRLLLLVRCAVCNGVKSRTVIVAAEVPRSGSRQKKKNNVRLIYNTSVQ